MITLHCKIAFESKKDKEKLIKLMRRFSSCYGYAYSRLLEKQERKDLINLCKETGENPEKVIFGGRKLFEKLKKKHLNGQQSEKLRALAFPVLGKALSRDLSLLKAIIVSGDWDRVARRLAPVSWDRGYVLDKYRQLGICPELNKAGYKYPSPECSFVHFG
jgi:hypothetical protein